MRRGLVGIVVLALFFSVMHTVGADASRDANLPQWGTGTYWKYKFDDDVSWNQTIQGGYLNVTHATVEVTYTVRGTEVFKDINVYNVTMVETGQIVGRINVGFGEQPFTATISGSGVKYIRISDLAFVNSSNSITINFGVGSMTRKDWTEANPPKVDFGFPLTVPDNWHVDTIITHTYIVTSPGGTDSGTETTHLVYDATVDKMEDITVPAGTFSSYYIEESGTSTTNGNTTSYQQTRYYSEEIRNEPLLVVYMMENRTVVIELIEYSLNTPPVVKEPLPKITIQEDDTTKKLDLQTIFEDKDEGDSLIFSAKNYTNITVSIKNSEASFIPKKDWNGEEYIIFKAVDKHGAFAEAEIEVEVTYVNDEPFVARQPSPITFNEDSWIKLNISGVFDDADIPYGDVLTYTLGVSENISATLQPNNTVNISSKKDWSGDDVLTITATDEENASTYVCIQVHVNPTPDEPVVIAKVHEISMKEDETYIMNLSERFDDPDIPYGDRLTYTYHTTENLTIEIDGDNATIRPSENWNGENEITIICEDLQHNSVNETIMVKVEPDNDPPVIISYNPRRENVSIDENKTMNFNLSAEDVDDDKLEIKWYLDGNEVGKGDNYTYAPSYDDAGMHTIRVVVSDGLLEQNITWNVTVNNVNRAPVNVKILEPKNGTEIEKGKKINFRGSALDPDGDNLTYIWLVDGKEICRSQTFETKNLTEGKHVVTLEVTDGKDKMSTSIILIVKKKEEKQPGFEVLVVVISLISVSVLFIRRRK